MTMQAGLSFSSLENLTSNDSSRSVPGSWSLKLLWVPATDKETEDREQKLPGRIKMEKLVPVVFQDYFCHPQLRTKSPTNSITQASLHTVLH